MIEDFNLDLDLNFANLEQETNKIFNVGKIAKVKKFNQPMVVRDLVKKINSTASIPKSKILQINSKAVLEHLPGQGEVSFFVMDGNCIFLDYILTIIKAHKSKLSEIYLTSLSLNEQTFERINQEIKEVQINLLISSYWLSIDKTSILERYYLDGKLENYRIGFYRNHTKIILLRFENGESYTISGSANLRSSNTLEQFVLIRDDDIYQFNKDWIDTLLVRYPYNFLKKNNLNTPDNFNFLTNYG